MKNQTIMKQREKRRPIILSILLAVMLLLSLAACGETAQNEDLYGTYKVDCIEYDGSKFTVEEWKVTEDEDLSGFYIIIKEGGKAYVYEDDYGELVDWLESKNNIMIDGEKCSIFDGVIHYDYYGDTLHLKKVSDDQQIPDEEEDEYEEEYDDTVEEDDITEQEPVDDTVDEQLAEDLEDDTIDPDFKSAMDSYEKFMDDYVAFMKKYSANPTDMSLIADYATYITKYAEFVEDFNEWQNEELNTAEALYYAEVQTRVSQKLLEVAE